VSGKKNRCQNKQTQNKMAKQIRLLWKLLFCVLSQIASHLLTVYPQVVAPVFSSTRVYTRMGSKMLASLTFLVLLSALLGINFAHPSRAAAAANNTINFQAQLQQATGTVAANGNYNVEFKLYDAQVGGTAVWTESYLNSAAHGIKSNNGYITAKLGSLTPFPATMNWNQQLWLTMNIGGTSTTVAWDGEMNPRLQLTAVPYAFQANQLTTVSGNNTSTLSWLTQTAANSLYLPDKSGVLCVSGDTAGCGFAPANGSNGYIQNGTALQGGASFNVGGSGTIGGNLILNGTGAAIVGSSNGLKITVPDGDLSLSTTGSGSLKLSSATDITIAPSATGKLVLGAANGTGPLILGESTEAQSVYLGNGTGPVTVNIANVSTAGNTVNIAGEDSGAVDTINIGTGSTSVANGKVINIGTGTPTGSGSNKVTIGSKSEGSTTTLQGGALALQSVGYSVTLNDRGLGLGGVAVAATGDLSFGSGANRSINTQQATSGTGNDLALTAGQGAGDGDDGGNLLLQAGASGGGNASAGSVIIRSNGSDSAAKPAFAVQSANADNLLAAFTSQKLITIGMGTPTMASTGRGDLYVAGSAEFGISLRVGTAQNGFNFTAGVAPSASNGLFTGKSRPTKTISRVAQFEGMTAASNTNGTLTTGIDTEGGMRNYYNWTTSQKDAQSENMYIQVAVPRDFSGFDDEAQICYNVYTDDISGASSITTTFYDTDSKAQANFNAIPDKAGTWQRKCTKNIGGKVTVNGETYVTVQVNMTVAQNKNLRISGFSFDYLSAF
jgi:hypothetical protein